MRQARKQSTPLLFGAALLAVLAALPTFASAADGDKSKVKGLITHIEGDKVYLKDANNAEVVINVSPQTSYKKTKGLTGAMSDKSQQSALMAGLPISADVVESGGAWNATAISFKSEDFRTAQQVNAGTERTNKRMEDFGTYEALATVEVLFASGKTAITPEFKKQLDELAAKAKTTKDYRVVVQGYTDSTGSAAANERLSALRAHAVTSYLQKQGGLSPGRVMAGDAMGVAPDAGSGSNANARKVVARLVVDKGVQGGG
jgi:outer membrane protein OmpA-like peptidoglycan-associated protein